MLQQCFAGRKYYFLKDFHGATISRLGFTFIKKRLDKEIG
jgi:hypothetical protein